MSTGAWTFNDLKFPKPDLEVFKALYSDAIDRLNNAKNADDVLEILFEVDEMSRKAKDLLTAAFIHYTQDTTNEKYETDQRWVDENQPFLTKITMEFNEALYNSPFKEEVQERIGRMYFTQMDITKWTYCDENIPLRQRESELMDEYQRIIASCQEEIMGEPRTFMGLQGFFAHDDRNIRQQAFRAFSGFLAKNREKLEQIWDELIKVRTEIGKNLGHENFLPVGYLERGRLDYGKEEIAAFRQQVLEEIVPLCSKLYEAQAKRIGVDRLMAYDEKKVFSDGNAKPAGDAEFMYDRIIEMFMDMSPETDQFINFMLDHDLIDYESRPGKAAREYTTIIASKKAPFVFAHFDGSAACVQFLIEGLGHAFAAYRSSRRQYLSEYYSSTAEIMEIHSMAMTQFANKYAEEMFGEDAWKYIYATLHDFIAFIPFGVAVDEFQHICYENPDLTPEERNQEWRNLEKKYMPWRNYDEDDDFMNAGGFWFHKVHFFVYPLYYIEYALATVNAMEMYQRFVERPGTAWKEFLEITDVGGSKDYVEILKLANLTPAYEEGTIARSIGYVKQKLEEYI